MKEYWASESIDKTVPHQLGVILKKNGEVLVNFEVVEPTENQCFILFKSPCGKVKGNFAQACMFVGHDGAIVAQDQVINLRKPND